MDIYHLRPSDALEKVQQALSLKPEADHLYSMVVLQYTRATATVAIGDSESALESGRDSVPLAEKLRHRTWLGRAMSGNLFVTRARGDWAQARSYSDRGLEASPRDVRLLGPRALLERDLGDFEQGQIYIDRFVSLWDINNSTPTIEYCLSVCTIAMVARITGDARMFNKIQATADMAIALNAVTPLVETFSRIAKGIIAVIQEDAVTAKQQYDALGLIRGMFPYLIAGDRVLGLLCSTMGDMDRASDHFEDALTFCRKADYRPELAWTCCDYATTLLRRNNYGDSEKAATLLEGSSALARELGMGPLARRVEDLIDQVKVTPAVVANNPDGLSVREIQVLRLISVGKSNPEIGNELVISTRTVANHVASILNKTNTVNRTEAAAYPTRQGLV